MKARPHRTEGPSGRGGSATGLALFVLAALLVACDATLQHDLEETEANELVALLVSNGIPATKERAGPAGGYDVAVPAAHVADAWNVARAHDLPRAPVAGVAEWLDAGGLVPSPNLDRARERAALEGELARTLRVLEGVRDARVHLAVRPQPSGVLGRSDEVVSAAVVLRLAPAVAGPDDGEVRRLLAAAVDGLAPDTVTVVRTVAAPAAEVGATGVAASARAAGWAAPATLRAAVIALCGLVLVLSGLVLVLVRRGAGRRDVGGGPAGEVRL